MTPALLRDAGRALYGELWQVALSRALGVNDRTLRRWAAGQVEIPPTVAGELAKLCAERAEGLYDVADRLDAENVGA